MHIGRLPSREIHTIGQSVRHMRCMCAGKCNAHFTAAASGHGCEVGPAGQWSSEDGVTSCQGSVCDAGKFGNCGQSTQWVCTRCQVSRCQVF